jgi:transposase-like protein
MPPTASVPCPFCGSADTVKEADFGTSLMVNRRYCRRCRSSFEAVKWGTPAERLDLPGFLQSPDERESSHG